MARSNALDTRFRAALRRIAQAGQLLTYDDPVDTHLEAATIMKQLDGDGTLFFPRVKSYAVPVVGNPGTNYGSAPRSPTIASCRSR
jgi:UbiD family decarboxylase